MCTIISLLKGVENERFSKEQVIKLVINRG